jgi:hypothetical protein
MRAVPLLEKFDRFTEQEIATGCLLWTGGLNKGGYGLVKANGKTRQAHRVFYELFRGPIPVGLHIDHLCRTPRCVNPAHLEPVTCKENNRRGKAGETARRLQLSKTYCKHGHPRTEENAYWNRKGARVCRVCTLEQQRRKYQMKKFEEKRAELRQVSD